MPEMLKQGSFVRGESADENRVWPRFHIVAEQDHAKTANEGRPIFYNVEMVDMHFAGDPYKIVSVRVTDEHKQRWPKAYNAFKGTGEFAVEGTPLKEWPALSVAQVAEYNAMHIHTLEQLISVDDNGIQRMGLGARHIIAKAKAYLEAAQGNAPIEKLAAENIDLKEQIGLMQRQVDELSSAIKSLTQTDAETKVAAPRRGKAA